MAKAYVSPNEKVVEALEIDRVFLLIRTFLLVDGWIGSIKVCLTVIEGVVAS